MCPPVLCVKNVGISVYAVLSVLSVISVCAMHSLPFIEIPVNSGSAAAIYNTEDYSPFQYNIYHIFFFNNLHNLHFWQSKYCSSLVKLCSFIQPSSAS